MRFEYAVKYNGVDYPAGADVPMDKEPIVEKTVTTDEPKAEMPKATSKKRATKK